MKSWTLSDELRDRPDLAAAVEKLRPVLDGEVIPEKSAALVSADWRLGTDEDGEEIAVLRLTNPSWPAGVEEQFSRWSLGDRYSPRMGLRLTWSRLLGAGNEVRIARLLRDAEED